METQIVTWNEVNEVMGHANRILLFGITSTGKSYLAEHHAKYSVTLHDASSADELRGTYIPHGSEFQWHDGVCIRAWREGCGLVLNEINRASDEVKSFLYVICDNPESAAITLPTGETVRPSDGFKVIATMNGTPDELTDALRARFPVQFEICEPNPNAIDTLPEDLRKVASTSCVIRNESRRLTLRQWIAFAKLRGVVTEDLAARSIFGSRSEEVLSAIKLGNFDRF